jgi:hypothetical protein
MSYKRFPLAGDISNDEIATPANPVAGTHKVYFKTGENIPTCLNSAGSEVALGDDKKVLASAADTGTPDFLDGKLVAGANLVKTILTPAGDEDIEFSLDTVVDNTVVLSPLVTVDADATPYTVLATDEVILVDCETGTTPADITLNLPTAVIAGKGRKITVKKIDDGTGGFKAILVADTVLTETIDGAITRDVLYQYDSITLVSDGVAAWYVV